MALITVGYFEREGALTTEGQPKLWGRSDARKDSGLDWKTAIPR